MSDFFTQFVPGQEPKEQIKERPRQAKTGLVEQGMSGVNEGLASLLGFPIDMATLGLNKVVDAVGAGQIENPVGGSDFFEKMLDFSISDEDPQTAGQRFARRAGQEVGFGAPLTLGTMGVGPLAATAMKAPKTFAATNVAADAGAGIAGQASREIFPDSAAADVASSMIGGLGGGALAGRVVARNPRAQTREQLRDKTDQLYSDVKNSGADLTDSARDNLTAALRDRFEAEGGDALSFPKANAQIGVIEKNPRTSIYGVEQARRRIRDKVARTTDESSIGGDLIEETDSFLSQLQPDDVLGADPEQVVSTLMEARRSAHQGIKADEVADALDAANSSTATSGTGGNSLNNQSRGIKKLLDAELSRRKSHNSRGFTPDEVAGMEGVVFPGRGERALRSIGRLAPTTGGLQAAMTTAAGGGGLTAAATGAISPIAAAAFLTPSVVGMGAQVAAERIKKSKVDALMQTILNGGKHVEKTGANAARAALISQLLNAPQ